jgi:hypothetical protein
MRRVFKGWVNNARPPSYVDFNNLLPPTLLADKEKPAEPTRRSSIRRLHFKSRYFNSPSRLGLAAYAVRYGL